MKRIHRQAMRTARRLQDGYVDGEDDDAIEARDWHEQQEPAYEGDSKDDHHRDQEIPF